MANELPRFETLLLRRDGRALHVTLNRPDARNALSRAMVRELAVLTGFLEKNQDISVVVVRGAGGTFCAGGDIRGFMDSFKSPPPNPGDKDLIALNNREFGSFMTRFEALPQTIVMVVEGAAFGGGLGLLCAGDAVLCAQDARFALSETGLGIPPAQIAPFVAARIGVARTRSLALTGAHFDGREAERIGLVDSAHAHTSALDAALARTLGDIARRGPQANATTKRLLLASRTTPREDILDQSADAFAACLRSPEGQEGVTAFLEKRKPKWAG